MGLNEGWIIQDEVAFTLGGTAFFDGVDIDAEEASGVVFGVGNGGRRRDEPGFAPVEFTDTLQAAKDEGNVTAEDTPVGMEFIDDDEFQVFEEFSPFDMVRQDAGVQHIGITEDNMAAFTDGAPDILGGIAVVGLDFELRGESLCHVAEDGLLVLGEGFGGEEVEGAGGWVLEEGLQDGQVITEGFPGCGGGHDDDVLTGPNGTPCFGLVAEKLVNAAASERINKVRVEVIGEGDKASRACRQVLDPDDSRAKPGLKILEDKGKRFLFRGHRGMLR